MARKPGFILYYIESMIRLLAGIKKPLATAGIFVSGSNPGNGAIIRLRKSGLVFRVRGSMDVWSVKEAVLDRFYEKCGFALHPDWVVIDIGAGIGEFTLLAAQHVRRVAAFEPFPRSFELLEENIQLNQVKNVDIHPIAIASTVDSLVLDFTGGEPLQIQSSGEQMDVDGQVKISVPAISLDKAFLDFGIKTCNLLKLDCEGAEYDILFGAPKELFARIERIVMEYHDGVTAYSHKELAEYLEGLGYQVECFDNPVHGDIGYMRAARK